MDTVNTAENTNTENTITLNSIWLAMLGLWSRFAGTKSFFGICGLFAANLAVEFLPFGYNSVVLGVVFGLVPVVICRTLEYGRSDERFYLANLMYISFYTLFMLIVTTIIGSLTMIVAGVFPNVLGIAIGCLIGLCSIAIPFVASLHWHRKGTAWWKITLNLCAIYTAIVWTTMQISL